MPTKLSLVFLTEVLLKQEVELKDLLALPYQLVNKLPFDHFDSATEKANFKLNQSFAENNSYSPAMIDLSASVSRLQKALSMMNAIIAATR